MINNNKNPRLENWSIYRFLDKWSIYRDRGRQVEIRERNLKNPRWQDNGTR